MAEAANNVGQHTSLVLDAAGLPVVSHYDATNFKPRLFKCGTLACTSGNSSQAIEPAAFGGTYTSVALDSTGNPVVSYRDVTNADLKVLRCGNATCTSGNFIARPDSAASVGAFTSLALDASGFPVVSYQDATNGDLKLLFCGSSTCNGSSASIVLTPTPTTVPAPGVATPWIVLADRDDVVGANPSIQLNAGKPVVAYRDTTYNDLKLLACGVNTCASGNVIRTLDQTTTAGQFASLALDASANPVVSYYESVGQDLRVARCSDPTCLAPPTITVVDSTGNVGQHTSIQVDAAGNPAVAYYHQGNGDLKLVRCGDATCSSGNTITTIDSTGNVGQYASLRLNASGNPVIAYQDVTNLDVKLVTCGNATCTSGNTTVALEQTGSVGHFVNLRLDSAGRPVVAYALNQSPWIYVKVVRCGNATCTSGNTIQQPDFAFNWPPNVSMALAPDDRPVLAYGDGSFGGTLKLFFCGNATCSSGNVGLRGDTASQTGAWGTSIAVDGNGVAAVAYHDGTDLRVLRCRTSVNCTAGGGLGPQSLVGGPAAGLRGLPTATETATHTPTPTATPVATATETATPTATSTPASPRADTATPSASPSLTPTASRTASPSGTTTPLSTSIATASATAAMRSSASAAASATPTTTATATSTPSGGAGGSGFAPEGGPEVLGVQVQAGPCEFGQVPVGTPTGVSPIDHWRYQTDRLSRTICVAGPSASQTYAYDPAGNRLSLVTEAGTTAYDYDRADRIELAGTTAYTVSARGNVTGRGGDVFAYDQANRLTSATVGGVGVTHAYSGDGLRVATTAEGETTRAVYDVNRAVPVILVEGGTRHVWGANGVAWSVTEDGSALLYHADGQGSVRAVTDQDGEVLQTYRTDPWGVVDPSGTGGDIDQPFRYGGGGVTIDPADLALLNSRFGTYAIDPATGRRMAAARLGLPAWIADPEALNPYAFAGNNPASRISTESLLAGLHLVLDVCGFVPGAGEPCDLANAVIYIVEGDEAGAITSVAALVPVAGIAASGSRVVTRAVAACNSFDPDTPVLTEGGPRRIADIQVGDYVLAWDERTGEVSSHRVTHVWMRSHEALVVLTLGDDIVVTTLHHLFLIEGKGWVAAGLLRAGDLVRTSSESPKEVTAVETVAVTSLMHDLTVEAANTYFVGLSGLTVHNNCLTRFASRDPGVSELAHQIEHRYPGHVLGVNRQPSGPAGGDLDIELANAIIEVKYGRGQGLTRQVRNRLSGPLNPTGKVVIAYAPRLSPHARRSIEAAGGLAASQEDLPVLLDVLRP